MDTDSTIRIASGKGVGVTINVTPSSLTPTLLPKNTAGEFPRVVRILPDANPCYVAIGPAFTGANSAYLTATLNNLLINPNDPVLLHTRGNQYFNAVTRGVLTTNLNVTAVEL